VNHRAFLYVDVIADDNGVVAVAPDGNAGPDAGILSDFHVADHVGELADPGCLGNLGGNAVESANQVDAP